VFLPHNAHPPQSRDALCLVDVDEGTHHVVTFRLRPSRLHPHLKKYHNNQNKLLIKRQGTPCPAGSVSVFQPGTSHRVVLPCCTQAVTFIELPVDNDYSQGFNGSLAVHLFVRNLLWQRSWGSRKRSHFSTCHTLHSCTCSTPSRYNQGQSLCSMQLEHSSLYRLTRLCENQGCSLTFFE
jgi:hypothetical protein